MSFNNNSIKGKAVVRSVIVLCFVVGYFMSILVCNHLCLVGFPLVVRVLCLSLFCCALLCVTSSFASILKRKRELVALILLAYGCLITVNVL